MTREEKFKLYFDSFRNIYQKNYNEQQITEKVNWLLDKEESLPKSKQSITVQYYDFLIDVEEIEQFRIELENANIELGHYNKAGDFHNDFAPADIIIVLNNPWVIGVASGIIVELIKSIYRKVRGKKITIHSSNSKKERDIIFEASSCSDGHLSTSIRIEGALNDEQIDKLIDKFPILASQNNQIPAQLPIQTENKYVPNEDNSDWQKYDLLEQIKKARNSND